MMANSKLKIVGGEENKKVVAESEGKVVENKNEPQITQMNADSGKREKSKEKKGKEKKEIVELEREYVVPLKRGVLNAPRYKRAKKAIRVLRKFMVRHMQIRDGDLKKVKIDGYLNNEIWFRGIKKPMGKVRVKAKKVDGIVYVELAEIPEAVKFVMNRDEKRKIAISKVKVKKGKKEEGEVDADKDGVSDKIEEKEDVKSGAEKAAKMEKAMVKEVKHTAQGSHMKKTMPVRKALKK